MNQIRGIFDASYEIGRAASLAAMHGNGSTILADGARKLAGVQNNALKSAAAELSAIAGNWQSQSGLVSGVFHTRVQKVDDEGPLFHAASSAYQLGTMREYCQHEVTDFSPNQIADGIQAAEAHGRVLRDMGASAFLVEMKFGAVEDPIRLQQGKKNFGKELKNYVQFIDALKAAFANTLG